MKTDAEIKFKVKKDAFSLGDTLSIPIDLNYCENESEVNYEVEDYLFHKYGKIYYCNVDFTIMNIDDILEDMCL